MRRECHTSFAQRVWHAPAHVSNPLLSDFFEVARRGLDHALVLLF
ncbi:Hypothetical protein, putative [Bodo saltans]|uniref:Uncharacterized protein n=1 Tax=Bodo saltans TaxID=75058 RepID=A0A0S4J756_BODSA|nr:Hypothetical protein, putative [Bodo saltans]|eukprot:CUG87288.1 Hypothetical protein, putative [Bodo saltans]